MSPSLCSSTSHPPPSGASYGIPHRPPATARLTQNPSPSRPHLHRSASRDNHKPQKNPWNSRSYSRIPPRSPQRELETSAAAAGAAVRHLCWPLHAVAARLPLSVPTGMRTAPPGSFASSRGGIPTNTFVAYPPCSCTRRLERPTPTPPFRTHLKSTWSSPAIARWVRCNHEEGEFHVCAHPMRTGDWCFCVYVDVDTSGQGFEWPLASTQLCHGLVRPDAERWCPAKISVIYILRCRRSVVSASYKDADMLTQSWRRFLIEWDLAHSWFFYTVTWIQHLRYLLNDEWWINGRGRWLFVSQIAIYSVLINGLCRKWEVEALEDPIIQMKGHIYLTEVCAYYIIQMKGHIDLTEVCAYTDVLPICTLSQ